MTRRLGLGTRLSVSLLTVLLALQLIALVFYVAELDARRRDRLDLVQRVGQSIAVAIDTHLRDIESTSVAVAEALAAQARIEQAGAGPYLARVIAEYPSLRAIFVTDPAGRVIATNGTGLGVDLSARPYLRTLKAGAEKVWSGSLTGIESGEITVAFGRRIGGASAPLGHLIFAFHPDRLLGSLGLAGAEDSEIVLTDDHGLVIYDSRRTTLTATERDLSQVPEVQRALRGELVRISDLPLLGEDRYGAIVPIKSVDWAVAYLWPQAPLEDALRSAVIGQIALASLALLAAALLVVGIAARLTRPIAQLAREAGGIARGERPAIKVAASAGVEVQQLGDAMRAMSEAVGRREDELRFLAEASAHLGASLDYGETLAKVARLAVGSLADWCTIDVIEHGVLRRVEVAHADPVSIEVAQAFATRHAPRLDEPEHREVRVIRTGRSELVPEITDAMIREYAQGDDERERLARKIEARSSMTVPLLVRGVAIGAITFASTRPDRPYSARDLALAEDLARRAGAAIENSRLYHEVQNALRTRDEFLSAVAHELKTPLTTIKGFTQLLERALGQGRTDPEAFRATLSRIDVATTRMNTAVDELLDLARIQLGAEPELERSTVDLVELISDIARDHAGASGRHSIRVEAEPITGQWDRSRVERVIHNLLSNAVKYSPAGGEIIVRVRPDGDAAAVEVADHGVGIPPADLERIFVRFQRGSNVIGRIGGTGIGLTLVRQIVEQHGGTVTVESVPDQGTVFRLRLPFADAPPAPARAAP